MVLNGGVSSSVAWAGRGSELGPGLACYSGRVAALPSTRWWTRCCPEEASFRPQVWPSFVTSQPPTDLTTPAEVSPDPKEAGRYRLESILVSICFRILVNYRVHTALRLVETASQHFLIQKETVFSAPLCDLNGKVSLTRGDSVTSGI